MQASLPNGSGGDSLLLVRLPVEGACVAFDAGDPRRIPPRDVLRLAHLFVSHCHVDHFIGFDALIRPRVCRPESITVHGGPDFLARVTSRLGGYTWNLVDGNHFVVNAREILGDRVKIARFDSGDEFRRVDLPDESLDGDVAYGDELLRLESAALDHHVVSQGFAIERPLRVNVQEDRMRARGLFGGPWLKDLKQRAESGAELDEVARDILSVRRGERVAYVTDTACTDVTRPLIVKLAAAADVFACGAPFLSSEADRARQTRHLTAAEAGSMAAEAGAKVLLLFHVSDRHANDFTQHADEARDAAKGAVDVQIDPFVQRD